MPRRFSESSTHTRGKGVRPAILERAPVIEAAKQAGAIELSGRLKCQRVVDTAPVRSQPHMAFLQSNTPLKPHHMGGQRYCLLVSILYQYIGILLHVADNEGNNFD